MSRQLLIGIIVLLIIVAAIAAYMYMYSDPLSGVTLPINHWVLGGKGGIQMTITTALDPASMVGHSVTANIPELSLASNSSPTGTVATAVKGKAPGTVVVTTAPISTMSGVSIQTGSDGQLIFT